jgi:hypothetical protein
MLYTYATTVSRVVALCPVRSLYQILAAAFFDEVFCRLETLQSANMV